MAKNLASFGEDGEEDGKEDGKEEEEGDGEGQVQRIDRIGGGGQIIGSADHERVGNEGRG